MKTCCPSPLLKSFVLSSFHRHQRWTRSNSHHYPKPQPRSTRPSRPAVLTRKRTREDYLVDDDLPPSATSSDPALFSGDEATPGLESYQSKRKRKMFSGSWYEHSAKARKEDRRREFKRNVDSGIFMGSESETPSSDSIGSLEEALIHDQALKRTRKRKGHSLYQNDRGCLFITQRLGLCSQRSLRRHPNTDW